MYIKVYILYGIYIKVYILYAYKIKHTYIKPVKNLPEE